MVKRAPRLLVAGTGSGCGKTTAVCAILGALRRRGKTVTAFKCGPDYIDPMFHRMLTGRAGANIDLFFQHEDQARAIFLERAGEWNVIEGAMGYYDGMTMNTDRASAWAVAGALAAPTLLVVDASGMGLSAAALIGGFRDFRSPHRIGGLLLNRVSPRAWPRLKSTVEESLGLRVYGYLPRMPAYSLKSRHLGLVPAHEVENLREIADGLATQAEKTIDLAGLEALMRSQGELSATTLAPRPVGRARLAIAKDEAFCFYYEESLDLLRRLGAQLIPFSPLKDPRLPDSDGLYLGGGYPELFAEGLSENRSMRSSIREAVLGGLPTVAECGGFMYLTQRIGRYPMAGALEGVCQDQRSLTRFGYLTLEAPERSLLFERGDRAAAHEFHHWDCDRPGDQLRTIRPDGAEGACGVVSPTLYASFAHLYFPACPKAARRFVEKCARRSRRS